MKRINLFNVTTKIEHTYRLDDDYPNISIVMFYQLLEIIELFEPTADLNRILIQVKMNEVWQFVTSDFAVSVRNGDPISKLEIRYKIYNVSHLEIDEKEEVSKKLKICCANIQDFTKKFNPNQIDFNFVWASPIYVTDSYERKGKYKKEAMKYRVNEKYIYDVFEVLRKSEKRIHLRNNLFNEQSFEDGHEYSIVYLVCQTEYKLEVMDDPEKEEKMRKMFFIGESKSGVKIRIYPEALKRMLFEKKIQLLVLQTSYPFDHLKLIKECPGIKNILLVNESPVYRSETTVFFLQTFFSFIMQSETIQEAHRKSVEIVQQKHPEDEICCCYHEHDNIECCYHEKYNEKRIAYKAFTTTHYQEHYIRKKQNTDICCQDPQKRKELHAKSKKFQLINLSEEEINKNFTFDVGSYEGDVASLKSFEYKDNLFGNKNILMKAFEIFASRNSQYQEHFQVLNVFSKFKSIRKPFVEYITHSLIRRKHFKENKVIELKNLSEVQLKESKEILYTIIVEEASKESILVLSLLKVNVILVSDNSLRLKSINKYYEEVEIQPLDCNECAHYVKSLRHLNQRMKNNVIKFFNFTWKKEVSLAYYTTNFDYEGIVSVVAESQYENAERFKEQTKEKVNFNHFLEYILFMSVVIHLPKDTLQKETFNFFNENVAKCKITFEEWEQFLELNLNNFELIYQIEIGYVKKYLISILCTFFKLTYNDEGKISIFDSTTDFKESLIWMHFERMVELSNKCELNKEIEVFLRQIPIQYILKACLTLVRHVISCFFFLEDDKQNNDKEDEEKKEQKEQKEIKEPTKSFGEELADELGLKSLELTISFCLLLINNSVTFRKNSNNIKVFSYFSNEQEVELKFRKRVTSITEDFNDSQRFRRYNEEAFNITEDDLKSLESSIENEEEIEIEEEIVVEGVRKEYEEKDLRRNLNFISSEGLQYLLKKIINKNYSSLITAVAKSLHLQIQLESVYKIEDIYGEILKREFLSFIKMIKKWDSMGKMGRFRMLYDVVMGLFLVFTAGGRRKLTKSNLRSIKMCCKFTMNIYMRCEESDDKYSSEEILNLLEMLCVNKEVYLKIAEYIRMTSNGLDKRLENKKGLIDNYMDVIGYWMIFDEYKKEKDGGLCHDDYHNREWDVLGVNYIKLLNIKFKIEEILNRINDGYAYNYYSYCILDNLNNVINNELISIKDNIVLVLVSSPIDCKGTDNRFIIDYESLLSEDYANKIPNPNFADHLNRRDNARQTVSLSSNNKKKTVVKMYLNKQNLSLLEGKVCKTLIICAMSDVSKNTLIGENDIDHKGEYIKVSELANKISKIRCSYIFLSLFKPNDLINEPSLKAFLPKIVYFEPFKANFKKYPETTVLMLMISLCISELLHQNKPLNKAIREAVNTFEIIFDEGGMGENMTIDRTEICKLIKSLEFNELWKEEEYNYIMQYRIKEYLMIKESFLGLIDNIQNVQSIENFSKPNNTHLKKMENYDVGNFEVCFESYMTKKKGLEVYTIECSSGGKAVFEKIQNMLPDFYSSKRMCVIFKNFALGEINKWMKKELTNLLFNSHNGLSPFTNKYISVGDEIYLISFRE